MDDEEPPVRAVLDCKKLVVEQALYIRMANDEHFIPLCAGVSGKIGELVADPNHQAGNAEYPIDLAVLDIAKTIDLTEDDGAEEEYNTKII
jgi:hypothetical protein